MCSQNSFFFSPISFSKWEINACVDDDDNAAIWTSHGAMEVGKYVYVRERDKRSGKMKVMRWMMKRAVWILWKHQPWEERVGDRDRDLRGQRRWRGKNNLGVRGQHAKGLKRKKKKTTKT